MEYDVALSFAGEDREYVEAVANELKRLGVRVFYDNFETVNLWGKDLFTHLQNVYQKQAKYTVIFISEHYAKKLWTNHERKMAQARAFTESSEYILPARFDDTEIEGITKTIGYINLNKIRPEEFAKLVINKLEIDLGNLNLESSIILPKKNVVEPIVPKSDFNISIDKTSEISHLDVLESEQKGVLETKETNFVFLFGKPSVGKTSIIGSILYFLVSNASLVILANPTESHKNRKMKNSLLDCIRKSRFPARTDTGTSSQLEVRLIPKEIATAPLSITFLDMSGEDLKEVEIQDDSDETQQFPSNIEAVLKINNLSMNFILITSHDEAKNDDLLMLNFLDYLSNQDSRFQLSHFLLLISKWDTFVGGVEIIDFVKEQMPLTYARISKPSNNNIKSFYLGRIVENYDKQSYIQNYNKEPAENVFKWLIGNFPKKYTHTKEERSFIKFLRELFDFGKIRH